MSTPNNTTINTDNSRGYESDDVQGSGHQTITTGRENNNGGAGQNCTNNGAPRNSSSQNGSTATSDGTTSYDNPSGAIGVCELDNRNEQQQSIGDTSSESNSGVHGSGNSTNHNATSSEATGGNVEGSGNSSSSSHSQGGEARQGQGQGQTSENTNQNGAVSGSNSGANSGGNTTGNNATGGATSTVNTGGNRTDIDARTFSNPALPAQPGRVGSFGCVTQGTSPNGATFSNSNTGAVIGTGFGGNLYIGENGGGVSFTGARVIQGNGVCATQETVDGGFNWLFNQTAPVPVQSQSGAAGQGQGQQVIINMPSQPAQPPRVERRRADAKTEATQTVAMVQADANVYVPAPQFNLLDAFALLFG